MPRADITHIDNDITAWFSKTDPVYQDYERFRQEFGGTRTLIVALKADSAERLFSRETLDVHREGERRHRAGRDRPPRGQPGERDHRRRRSRRRLTVRPLLDRLESRDPADIRRAGRWKTT